LSHGKTKKTNLFNGKLAKAEFEEFSEQSSRFLVRSRETEVDFSCIPMSTTSFRHSVIGVLIFLALIAKS
jgi:hypothetical protein